MKNLEKEEKFYDEFHKWHITAYPKSMEFRVRDMFFRSIVKNYVKRLKKIDCKGKSVLDVGCGIGEKTELLNGKYVEGIDVSPYAIRTAKRRVKGINFQAVPFQNYKANRKFDLIFFMDSLEHMHLEKGVRKSFNLLNKDGRIVILCPNDKNLFHKIRKLTGSQLFAIKSGFYHGHEDDGGIIGRATLVETIEKNGFAVEKIDEFPRIWKEHLMIVAKKK